MGCTSCKQRTIIVENTTEIMENTQFKLRSQITFSQLAMTEPSFKVGEVTDEIVIEFLKGNPNRISLFSEFPENWRDMLTPGFEPTVDRVENIEVIITTSKDNRVKRKRK